MLEQPIPDTEQPEYTGPHISGPRVTFIERPWLDSQVTYQTLYHIRDGEIHERRMVDWGLEIPMYSEGPETDEMLYGRPVDAARAQQIIWWIESSIAPV